LSDWRTHNKSDLVSFDFLSRCSDRSIFSTDQWHWLNHGYSRFVIFLHLRLSSATYVGRIYLRSVVCLVSVSSSASFRTVAWTIRPIRLCALQSRFIVTEAPQIISFVNLSINKRFCILLILNSSVHSSTFCNISSYR